MPDKLAEVEGLGNRSVLAIDATYQKESSHYTRVLPEQGGNDNQKGHMLLTYYDLRKGVAVHVKTQTVSMGEMRVLKQEDPDQVDWSRIRGAIYVVDRAFIDGTYWDERKKNLKSTVITRMKSTLNYAQKESRTVSALACNENVLSDSVIDLKCSKQPWRLIEWKSYDGVVYQYLTNDFTLEPGVIAFLYYRRWDEEKYFDNFKNDLANSKAWGKSPTAIEQQALFGLMTYLLTRLFLHQRHLELGLVQEDNSQHWKQARKVEQYIEQLGFKQTKKQNQVSEGFEQDRPTELRVHDAYRAFYTHLSKITRQVWRFLKNCFARKSSPELYQRQFKPLLLSYL